MTSQEMGSHDGFFAVMRGVCYSREERTVWFNPRVFRVGHTWGDTYNGEDFECVELVQALLDTFWPHLSVYEDTCTDCDKCLPGMLGDRPQVPGNMGYELFTVKA